MNTDRLRKLYETSTNKHDAAKKMGVSFETLQRMLEGKDCMVSTLEKIAKYYNVPIGYFFDEAEADGRNAQQLEIENLKGQIKGMEKALDRLGFSLQGFIIEDN